MSFRELLEKIKDFEDCQFSGAKSTTDFSVFASKLEPMNDAGAAALLTVVCNNIRSYLVHSYAYLDITIESLNVKQLYIFSTCIENNV